MLASRTGDVEIVDLLVDAGADVNHRSSVSGHECNARLPMLILLAERHHCVILGGFYA